MTIGVSAQIGGLLYVENLLTNHVEVYRGDKHQETIKSALAILMLNDIIHNRKSVIVLRKEVDKFTIDSAEATTVLKKLSEDKKSIMEELEMARGSRISDENTIQELRRIILNSENNNRGTTIEQDKTRAE